MKLRHKLILDYYVGGLLHVLLRPPTILLGRLLRRDHRIGRSDGVVFVKFLGGGSLVIACPSLLAIKNAGRRLTLVTTAGIRPFAETLGVFDEIHVVRDGAISHLALDSISAIFKVWRCPVLVDLEIHSRLSTVFCLLTCAVNRVSFYSLTAFWRRNLATHLLYYNAHAPIHQFYDQVSQMLGAPVPDFAEAKRAFVAQVDVGPPLDPSFTHVGIAATCSNLSLERMLRVEDWVQIVSSRFADAQGVCIHLLGAPADRPQLETLAAALARPGLRIVNHAGEMSLQESVALLAGLDRLLAIDSALLHFARLLGVPTESWWGPTSPLLLLRDLQAGEAHYRPLSCSPCIHVTGDRPCRGDNRCMRAAVAPANEAIDDNPLWLTEGTLASRRGNVANTR